MTEMTNAPKHDLRNEITDGFSIWTKRGMFYGEAGLIRFFLEKLSNDTSLYDEYRAWRDANEKRVTITTGSGSAVQGVLITDHGNGKASVRVGDKVYTGALVGDATRAWNARASLSPVVKPLEWHDYGDDLYPESRGSVTENVGFHARISYIRTGFVEEGWYILGSLLDLDLGPFKTLEDAKSNRQIAYEKRILSALNFTPSDKDKEIERLRKALSKIEGAYYNEGEDVKRRAARMRALASEALEERG